MSQAFSDWLRRKIGEAGLSERRVSEEAGLGATTVNWLLRHPQFDPRPETCRRLAAFFRVPEDYLLRLAGHLTPGPADRALKPEEEDLLIEYRLLSPARRRAVQEIVRGLRQLDERQGDRPARKPPTPQPGLF